MIEIFLMGFGIGFIVACYIVNVFHEVKLYKEAKELLKCPYCDGTGWSNPSIEA